MPGVPDRHVPSLAWASVVDKPFTSTKVSAHSALLDTHPARARLEVAMRKVLDEFSAPGDLLQPSLRAPTAIDLEAAATWLVHHPEQRDNMALLLAVPVDELPAWASDWNVVVSAKNSDVLAVHAVLPTTPQPELLVQLAGFLQDDLYRGLTSQPVPPCPAHGHPLKPELQDGSAYWVCPVDGPLRTFR